MKFVSNLDFNNTSKIVNASVPTANQDGATKNYADTTIGPPSLPTVQIFTSSGSWTRPTNCKKIKVTVVGGGGKGGRITTPDTGNFTAVAGGGGGGGTAVAFIDVTGSNYSTARTVTIGSGATANEGTGGTSSFNTGTALVISATGGQAPAMITAEDVTSTEKYSGIIGSGGQGGSGTISTGTGYVITGGGGGAGIFSDTGVAGTGDTNVIGGLGGGSFFSGKSVPSSVLLLDGIANGSAGNLYGGGGSGGAQVNDSGAATGGNGAAGIVIVEEFY